MRESELYRDQDGTLSDRPFRPDDVPVRPGRGPSLRTHLPPGLDNCVGMPEAGSRLAEETAPHHFVGEGGAATSPGQAVGAGTALPLRRNREGVGGSHADGVRVRTVPVPARPAPSRIIPEITNAIPGEVCWLCRRDAAVVIGGLMWSYCEDCGSNRLALELAVAMWRVVKDTWASKRGGP